MRSGSRSAELRTAESIAWLGVRSATRSCSSAQAAPPSQPHSSRSNRSRSDLDERGSVRKSAERPHAVPKRTGTVANYGRWHVSNTSATPKRIAIVRHMAGEYDPTEIPGLRRRHDLFPPPIDPPGLVAESPQSEQLRPAHDEPVVEEPCERPKVSFGDSQFSDTTHLRQRTHGFSLPEGGDHQAGRPGHAKISRLDAERAGRLYLQAHQGGRMSGGWNDRQSRASSSRVTSRCQTAIPRALREARPDLMNAVLGDDDTGANLRENLAAMKRAHSKKVIEAVERKQTQLKFCHNRVSGTRTCRRCCAMSTSMGVLVFSVGLMILILAFQRRIVHYFLYTGPHVWNELHVGVALPSDIGTNLTVEYRQHFELNEPCCGFISVTGLVFALVFASNYTDAQSRLNEIRNSLAVESGNIHTAMLLVRTLDDTDPTGSSKSRVLLLLASYIEHLAEEIAWEQTGFGARPPPSNVEILYATIPFLSEIGSDGDGDDMDRVLVQRTVDALNAASEARQIRVSQEKRNISYVVYCFLWQLAFATYLGVIFLQTGSQLLNTCVSLMTITSVTTSMLILADLEKPYNGLVRVETDIFDIIRRDISVVLHEQDNEEEERRESACTTSCDAAHLSPSSEAPGSPGEKDKTGNSKASRLRSMSMRTKIDSDYHMREAMNRLDAVQANRVRRHSVDAGDIRTLTGTTSNDERANNNITGGGTNETKNGAASKYQLASAELPNTISG